MARRGENIHKRKDGRWEGRYIKARTPEGKIQWGYVYGTVYAEVKRVLIQKKAEAGFYNLKRTDLTFEALAEVWLHSLRNSIKESTYAHYSYTLHKYLLPVLSKVPVASLEESFLEQAMQQIIAPIDAAHKPLGNSSARECLSMLRRICKYEGYGAKRICNYLVEHNIMGRNGKNIPNITIGRMIRNKGYTGYLINGNVEKECPELRIIEPEVFEKAQELRDARRREKGEDADSYSPHALLCGKVFCAHCGNRLNITSSGRTRLRADGTVVKEKRYRYSCNFNVRHPGQCDGQSGYGVTTLDAVVESIVCMKFEEILECSKSNLLEEMRRKDLDAAKKEATRWKEEVQTKVDEQDALKKEMIRVIQGTSGLDREMIQQMVNENKEALLIAQTNLADSEKKLKEIEEQNQKAERNCSDLFTWASTYKGASFERRQAILKQFIKEVRVGRDYNIEIVLNVPLDEFEEFKRHAASAGRGKNQKNKSQNPQKVGRCTSNAGIVVLDKTAGETISIVPKNAAHAILRC